MAEGDEIDSGWAGRLGLWLGPLLGLVVLVVPGPADLPHAAQRLAAVVVLMAVWWATQCVPMAVTSLVPLIAFPLLGIDSAKNVAGTYLTDSSMLYLGGFIIALAIERWGLHRRVALHVVKATGTSPHGIVWGFMLATFLISMWISNTATTLMMLPIAMALMTSLEELLGSFNEKDPDLQATKALGRLSCQTYLGVAYAASIGGVATLVGTPTNMAFVGIWEKQFPQAPPISAGQWMATWLPFGLVYLGLAWFVLTRKLVTPAGFSRLNRDFFRERLHDLGPMSRPEWRVLIVFSLTAILWLTRTDLPLSANLIIPGWGGQAEAFLSWLTADAKPASSHKDWINDSTVGLLFAVLLFVIPAGQQDAKRGSPRLMDWPTANRLPWGILLLFGGGFAIAEGFRITGLSRWSGDLFAWFFIGQSPVVTVLGICALMIFLTEFTSNVATVNAVLPVFAGAAIALGLDPRLVMIPATIATSCGFMLPAGTPPNAIAFGTGRIPIGQMLKYGLWLNLMGIVLCTAATWVLLIPQMGIRLGEVPAWAVPIEKASSPIEPVAPTLSNAPKSKLSPADEGKK